MLPEKPSAFKLFIQDLIIPMAPFLVVAFIGIMALPVIRWIAERLP